MDKEWAAGSFTIQVRNGLQDCLQFECTLAPQWSVNIQLVQLTCQKFYPTWPGNVSKSCRLRYSNMDIKSSFVEWMRNGPQDRLPLPHLCTTMSQLIHFQIKSPNRQASKNNILLFHLWTVLSQKHAGWDILKPSLQALCGMDEEWASAMFTTPAPR